MRWDYCAQLLLSMLGNKERMEHGNKLIGFGFGRGRFLSGPVDWLGSLFVARGRGMKSCPGARKVCCWYVCM